VPAQGSSDTGAEQVEPTGKALTLEAGSNRAAKLRQCCGIPVQQYKSTTAPIITAWCGSLHDLCTALNLSQRIHCHDFLLFYVHWEGLPAPSIKEALVMVEVCLLCAYSD
jgi:hypothetical protein